MFVLAALRPYSPSRTSSPARWERLLLGPYVVLTEALERYRRSSATVEGRRARKDGRIATGRRKGARWPACVDLFAQLAVAEHWPDASLEVA